MALMGSVGGWLKLKQAVNQQQVLRNIAKIACMLSMIWASCSLNGSS